MEKRLPYSRLDPEVRKGPWTMEEDSILINYIANHGKGFWNSLAKAAGLKRTGKSCRLRWLNYLRPDVRRGNITPDEQLLIIELQAKWGNRWSKIAKYLPGRTDNEIKNFWRTRIQKHMKQLQDTLSDLLPPPDQTNVDPRHASTTQTSGLIMTGNTFELNSPPTAFWHVGGHDQMSADHHHAGTSTDVIDAYSPPAAFQADHDHRAGAFQAPAESNKSYWGMEGLWSMQLLNDD